MFGVVYCADFYIQCERLFRPEFIGQCLVITANGEIGNAPVIASSKEARALGIKPGLVGDQLTELFTTLSSTHTITVCSPNYELYADLSMRLIKSLELLAPRVSAGACNEAILVLEGLTLPRFEPCRPKQLGQTNRHRSAYHQYAIKLRDTLKQWLGLSVVIGIATTKTLAKLACDAAHIYAEYAGVIDLSPVSERAALLKRIAVVDISGVSKKVANRLSQINIHTALDLSQAPKNLVRRHSSMITERIAIELSGLACNPLEQSLVESSVFTNGRRLQADNFKQMKGVLDTLVVTAIEQLNSLKKNCNTVSIVLAIVPLNEQDPAFENHLSSELNKPINSIAAIRKLAIQLLESLWRDGHQYQSLRLNLGGLGDEHSDQIGLFSSPSKHADPSLNKASQERISLEALMSIKTAHLGRPSRSSLSPSFTTKWGDIARVR
ncbi:MAG: DNA polymerase V [Arenicella sp.]|jgi:DNA polymerase V